MFGGGAHLQCPLFCRSGGGGFSHEHPQARPPCLCSLQEHNRTAEQMLRTSGPPVFRITLHLKASFLHYIHPDRYHEIHHSFRYGSRPLEDDLARSTLMLRDRFQKIERPFDVSNYPAPGACHSLGGRCRGGGHGPVRFGPVQLPGEGPSASSILPPGRTTRLCISRAPLKPAASRDHQPALA